MKLTKQKPRFPGDLIQRYEKITAKNKTKKVGSIFLKKNKKSNKKGKK